MVIVSWGAGEILRGIPLILDWDTTNRVMGCHLVRVLGHCVFQQHAKSLGNTERRVQGRLVGLAWGGWKGALAGALRKNSSI